MHRRIAYDDDTGGHIAHNTRHEKKNVDRCDGRENKHWNLLGTKIVMQIIVNVPIGSVECVRVVGNGATIIEERIGAADRSARRRKHFSLLT